MLDKIVEAASKRFAERWLVTWLPALLFWVGGGIAWAHGVLGWSHSDDWLRWATRQSIVVQLCLLIGILVMISGSIVVVNRLVEPAFSIVKGSWPTWVLRTWQRVARRVAVPYDYSAEETRFQELQRRFAEDDPTLRPVDLDEYLRLDERQYWLPALPYQRMPTKIGNICRSAEDRIYDKYGLAVTVVWPRLRPLLPEAVAVDVVTAHQAMTTIVTTAMWGLLFMAFGIFTLWAVPAGLLVAVLALWGWLPRRAREFAKVLESTFDLHRNLLYRKLRWPLPENPARERERGLQVTQYLWRGSDATEPSFDNGDDT